MKNMRKIFKVVAVIAVFISMPISNTIVDAQGPGDRGLEWEEHVASSPKVQSISTGSYAFISSGLQGLKEEMKRNPGRTYNFQDLVSRYEQAGVSVDKEKLAFLVRARAESGSDVDRTQFDEHGRLRGSNYANDNNTYSSDDNGGFVGASSSQQ